MKAVQVLFDEALLRKLDADEEVRNDGRSAVLRRAAAEYLRRRQARSIANRYRAAYGEKPGLGADWAAWEDEGEWPGK